LVLIGACKGGMLYDHSTRNFVLKFPYANYIGKTFGEFHRDFKTKADQKGIVMDCKLYYPKGGLVGGTELQVGHGYEVAALTTNGSYYTPDFRDTIPKCFECSCIQNDTAKISGFILSKDNEHIQTYK
jgi:hypothetical protein